MPAPLESVVRVTGRRVATGALALVAASCGDGATSGSAPTSLTEVTRAEVVLAIDSIPVGDSITAQARTVNREGTVITPSRAITWSSGDTTVVAVSGSGVLRGRNVGTATLTVTADGVSATKTFRIVSRPLTVTLSTPDTVGIADTVELQVSVATPGGVALPAVAPRLASSDTSIVAVVPVSSGRAQVALRTGGDADLLAIVGTDTTRRRITVRLADVTSLQVVVESRIVDIGDSVPYTLVARNPAGSPVSTLGAVLTTEPAGAVRVRNGWVIGVTSGRSVLRARYGALAARDTVTALGPSDFQLDIVDGNPQSPLPARMLASMARVTEKWRRVIRTSPPGEFVRLPQNECRNSVPIAQFISGVRVLIKLDTLGVRIAGQGGPCLVRESGLPLIGTIQINALNWAQLSDRKLDDLIQHEVGHVLGIGTIWLFEPQSILVDGDLDAPDPIFVGPAALTAFALLQSASQFAGRPVPVEVRLRGHWRVAAFGGEVMAPVLVPAPQVTSAVTVAALKDLGWSVELEAYEDYTLPSGVLTPGVVSARVLGTTSLTTHSLDDDILLPQLLQTRTGQRVPIRAVRPRSTIQR